MKQDPDIKTMSQGELRREIMKLRRAIRKHRNAEGNARCWHNDLELYDQALPEAEPAGRMNLPESTLLRNCRKYIRRQQCKLEDCPRLKTVRR